MLITVITVCFNAGDQIAGCIDSVRAQTYPEVEHLIIDGASTDGTLDVIKSKAHPGLRWISEPDEGLYDALNKGFAEARGDVIGLMHADDFFAHERVLERVAEVLGESGDGGESGGSRAGGSRHVDACYGDLDYVDADDVNRVVRHWESCEFRPGLFGGGWMPPHPTFYARREVYERHGAFDTQFKIGADWDLMLRLFEVEKIQTRYLPVVMVKMRTGGVSNRSLKNIVRNNWECIRAFGKYGLRVPLRYPFVKLVHRLSTFRPSS